jgi:hypothetical protein
MRPRQTAPVAGGALVVLCALSAGCPSGPAGTGDAACLFPLYSGVCAALPEGFGLESCGLYLDPGQPPLRHGDGWRRAVPAGQAALPSPCLPGQVELSVDRPAPAGAPVLICNPPAGGTCPAEDRGSALVCQRGPLPAGSLGPGVSAASLASDGDRLAAIWARPGDHGGPPQAAMSVLDTQLAPVAAGGDGGPTPVARCEGGAPVEVSLWSAPWLTAQAAEGLAAGSCRTSRTAGRPGPLWRLRTGELARDVCPDVGDQVSALSSLVRRDGEVAVALTIDCSAGTAPPGQCAGTGAVVLPAGQLQPDQACDSAELPLVTPPAFESVDWIDARPVLYGTSTRATVVASLHQSDLEPARISPGLVGSGLSTVRLSAPFEESLAASAQAGFVFDQAPPTLATDEDWIGLAWGGPGQGLFVSTYRRESDGTWSRRERTLVLPDAQTPRPSHGATPYLAGPPPGASRSYIGLARTGATELDGFGACYSVVLDDGSIARRSVAAVSSDVNADRPNLLPGEGPCSVIGVPPGIVGDPVPAAFLHVSSGRLLLSTLGGQQQQVVSGIDPAVHRGIQDLQAGGVPVVAMLGDDAGYTAYRIHWGVDCAVDADCASGGLGQCLGGVCTGCLAGQGCPVSAEQLWSIQPGDYLGRPLLQREVVRTGVSGGSESPQVRHGITYLDPMGRVHRRPLAGGQEAIAAVPAASVQATGTDDATVYAGPFQGAAPDAAGRVPSGAWLRPAGSSRPRRLVPRPLVAVGGTVLAERADGQTVAAMAPVDQPFSSTGLLVSELASSVTARARLDRLAESTDIRSVGLSGAEGAGNSLFALYTQVAAPGPGALPVSLVSFGTDGATAGPAVALRDDSAAASSPVAGAALVQLGQGVLGASFCRATGAGVERWLVPVDLRGQVLGRPLSLGLQLERSSGLFQASRLPADCPPATLVWHRGRLLSSSLKDGEVQLHEVSCDAQVAAPTDGGVVADLAAGPDGAGQDSGDAAPVDAGIDQTGDGDAAASCPAATDVELPLRGAPVVVSGQLGPTDLASTCGAAADGGARLRVRTPSGLWFLQLSSPVQGGRVPVLEVRSGCDGAATLACSGAASGDPATVSLGVQLAGDGTYDLRVGVRDDGTGGASGTPWQLQLALLPVVGAGGPCGPGGPPVICGDGLTCTDGICRTGAPDTLPRLDALQRVDQAGQPHTLPLRLRASDPGGDLQSLRLVLLDQAGGVLGDTPVTLSAPTAALDQVVPDPFSASGDRAKLFQVHHAEVSLFDTSTFTIADQVVQPGLGETCDPAGVSDRCVGFDGELACHAAVPGGTPTCQARDDRQAACAAASAVMLDGSSMFSLAGTFQAGQPGLFEGSCSLQPTGSEQVAQVTIATATAADLHFSTDNLASTGTLALVYLRGDCLDPRSERSCASSGRGPGGSVAGVLSELPPGSTHVLFIDDDRAPGDPAAHDYRLDLWVVPVLPAGASCDPTGQSNRCGGGLACSRGGVCQ